MLKSKHKALGLALASTIAAVAIFGFGTAATAQVRGDSQAASCAHALVVDGQFVRCLDAPGQTASPPPVQPIRTQSSASPPSGERLLVTTSSLTGGYRAARQGDNDVGLVSIEAYNAAREANPGMAPAEAVSAENRSACSSTGDWVRRSLAIKARTGTLRPRLDTVSDQLLALGQAENRVSWTRRGIGIAGTAALCAIPGAGWLYCAGAVAGAVNYEAQSTTRDRAGRIQRDQSQINVEQSRIQLDATDLTMDMNIGWANMIHGYCLDYRPDDTLGPVS